MSRRDSRLVDIDAIVMHETEKALLLGDGDKTRWVSKSLVEYDEDTQTATMPEWYALEKELI